MKSTLFELIRKGFALLLASALALAPIPVIAQENTITNGSEQGLPPGFRFELEVPLFSLKTVPTWNELEQLLDNPYATVGGCSDARGAIPTNTQGIGGSRCSTIERRPSFGVTLPPLLVHNLRYNPATGEHMRLLNPEYPGGPWMVPDELVQSQNNPDRWNWTYKLIDVSPGAERFDETAIDYNSPTRRGGARLQSNR